MGWLRRMWWWWWLWRDPPTEYQYHRETRAIGHALRAPLEQIVVLAGYSPAGAEEIPTEPAPPAPPTVELTRLFMRHASISTTSEHYMHADKEELIAGMRRLEERWEKE